MVIFNRIHPSPKKRAQQRTFKMTLFRYINFLFRSLTLTLTVLVFGIYLFLLMLVLVLQRLSLYWEILIMLLSQFPWNFCHIKKGLPFLIAYLWVSMFRLELMYISLIINIRSSLTHLHLHAAAIAHRNHFLYVCVYQQNKSSESKV